MIPIRAAGLAAASLAPEIFHAFTFRLFRRLRTRVRLWFYGDRRSCPKTPSAGPPDLTGGLRGV